MLLIASSFQLISFRRQPLPLFIADADY